jgi:guanylate kinase
VSGRPFPIVLSAPSGGGKTTIARRILEQRSDVGYSVSCTTRSPRPGEVDGVDYHFLTRAAFDARVAAAEFAEWAEVHGNRYGTLKSAIASVVAAGKHVMMDIDVQGARQVTAAFPDALTIFVVPPSVEVLMDRLLARRSEKPEALALRLRNARHELLDAERYQHVVVNDELDQAIGRVSAIIEDEVHRSARRPPLGSRVEGAILHLLAGLERRADGVP